MRLRISELGLRAGAFSKVSLGKRSLWIKTSPTGLPERVLADKCAHMGSPLEATQDGFMCRTHGWLYSQSGENTVPQNPGLENLQFSVDGDELEVHAESSNPLFSASGALKGDETLELLAHASFLLRAEDRVVLFDPWLEGPTYWGSWHHYPKNDIDIQALGVTDIIITHPHPDHFHLPTMSKLPREVNVFIPNFESGILQRELRALGFEHVNLTGWEESVTLAEDFEFAFLRPISQWEDASCLVRVKGWIWLNQNDSGAALKDELLPESLDLLTTSFDVGASGYPLTWDEISDGRKGAIVAAAKTQILSTIQMRAKSTQSKYFAPFAGWWRHGLLEHEAFSRTLVHTQFEDLREVFRDSETSLLETIPSSKIVLQTMGHTWDAKVLAQLASEIDRVKFEEPRRALSDDMLKQKLREHLSSLALLSHASNSENVEFTVSVPTIGLEITERFGLLEGDILVRVRAEVPEWIGELLVSGDSTCTWNHVDIGYWARWSRSPDIYPANFMRLLQLGYVPDLAFQSREVQDPDHIERKSIAELIELNPELISSILNRAGLPCAACTKTNSDSLGNAFEIHSVPDSLRSRARKLLEAAASRGNG